ncbi:hypothetical protein [Sorangium sp. So ce1151]|uniref:hypothetical protein n=1 Tax=Sorangium sp. So ce1151 TaxID=3133332 RepID=UPI003F5FA0DE
MVYNHPRQGTLSATSGKPPCRVRLVGFDAPMSSLSSEVFAMRRLLAIMAGEPWAAAAVWNAHAPRVFRIVARVLLATVKRRLSRATERVSSLVEHDTSLSAHGMKGEARGEP